MFIVGARFCSSTVEDHKKQKTRNQKLFLRHEATLKINIYPFVTYFVAMNNRSQGLDFLRCVAVVLVMFRHYHVNDTMSQIGWIGVDLFFVLSGFLVSGLLFQEYKQTGNIKAGRFLVRRGFKIYPAFWVVLIIHLLYFIYKGVDIQLSRVLAEFFFIQNFYENIIGISWTLAIEEHFYFLLVLLILISVRKGKLADKKLIIGAGLFILLICLGLRLFLSLTQPFNDWTHFFPTYLRIDSLVFGVLISWFYHFEHRSYRLMLEKKKPLVLLFIVVGLSMPFFFSYKHFIMNTIGLSLLYIAFGGVVCLVESSKRFQGKWLQPLIYVGRFSYPIYLVHLLFGPAVANAFRTYFFTTSALEWINDTINFLANIGIGIALSLLIEQPFLKIRDRYFPKSNKKLLDTQKMPLSEVPVR